MNDSQILRKYWNAMGNFHDSKLLKLEIDVVKKGLVLRLFANYAPN
ncbi:MAG: hypothetical protein GIW98_07380 [Candidatus Eremiobacteraeota bacterium]|nr:hypothetical protein [Candidatus Eremiobacteraeota bacterium]